MDSILNNTSFAFIENIGYKITDYFVGTQTAIGPNTSTDPARYITIPAGFSKAFVDIVSSSSNVFAFTLRPVFLDVSGTEYLYSTWHYTSIDNNMDIIVPSPGIGGLTNSSYMPHKWALVSSNHLHIKSTTNTQQTTVTVHLYYIE